MRLDTEFEPVAHRGFVDAKTATNRQLVEDGHGAWFGAFVDGLLVAQLGPAQPRATGWPASRPWRPTRRTGGAVTPARSCTARPASVSTTSALGRW